MTKIELLVVLPDGASSIDAYSRNYAKTKSGKVIGVYTTWTRPPDEDNAAPGVADVGQSRWLDDDRQLPFIEDGGCSVINISYEPVVERVFSVCNGLA